MSDDKTGACRRCKAACYVWQAFCGASCSAKWEAGNRDLDIDADGLPATVDSRAALRAAVLERVVQRRSSPIFCEHANECPRQCPCDDLCYCKDHSCKERG